MKVTLKIKGLEVGIEDRKIIDGFSLTVKKGEVHVLMGRNGSGKSTLALALMGHPKYRILKGTVFLDGKSIIKLSTDKRSSMGLFLAFQNPTEVPGVSLSNFLRTSYNSASKRKVSVFEFQSLLKARMKEMGINEEFMKRGVNEGFSGGERKLSELLQLSILKPKVAILDEIDSGLDMDSLKVASKIINAMKKETGILIITHYKRVLEHIKPDFVHILDGGRIVKSGDVRIVGQLEKKGYRWFSEDGDRHAKA
ncbi:Fe-S cluster assembly ATPase SufC [Candidatus Micrarchaeota archaeon RBG_16_49_10]|nr:MAG: Fe-S cluster assembly ATPase SufC [Candidatus Micrarchaeota archaeon RBG_16_49_10]